MPDKINVLQRADSLETSPELPAVSKLIVHVGEDTVITVGDDTGYVVETDLPFCTQTIANAMLTKLQSIRYQPFTANGAMVDPAAEVGDGVSVADVYGGIYNIERSFGHLYKADITAPSEEEVDHEYTYESPTERKYEREMGDLRASLLLQSDEIAAKVSSSGGSESFSWQLMSDHWSVLSNGQEIFRVDQNGGTFTGQVMATTGQIGGFTITASAIYNNIPGMDGTQNSGVYIGTDGIKLGQSFKVDASGHLTCSGATITSSVRANDIMTGGSNGYVTGGMIGGGTITQGNLNTYCSGGVVGGANFTSVSSYGSTSSKVSDFTCQRLYHKGQYMYFNGKVLQVLTTTISGRTIHYLGYA